ncbi:YfhD-like protein [Salinibacillus kushneri]|uniref:YfhD-like protein n=1 Tax=Salinibacillus kushneri TaxID=237682 RepID=A0A1I0DMI8_9BACI|nr:YfhD family protein [Salinibacillus kushneri]SET33403.1 YfhD-like protein [Salinibacillus kushneri]
MGRGQRHKPRDKNKQKLPQTPRRDIASDGRDIEFSQELADHDDLVAKERSNAADRRAKGKK